MRKFSFSIDRGGTFTDIYARCPNGDVKVLKLLSVDSAYEDAPREGIRRILQQVTGRKISREEVIDATHIDWIRMGTTVATNALLERNGERMALVITKGFRDLLHVGNQSRPKIFDLAIQMPEHLYEEVVEVEERVYTDRGDCDMSKERGWREDKSITGESVRIGIELQTEGDCHLRRELTRIREKGILSLSVVLLHSYMYPKHEERIGQLASELGFTHISLSSQVMPMIRAVPRGFTTAADAYLTPLIKKYIEGFSSGFRNLGHSSVLFMKSDGGLTPMKEFMGSRAILSGPAGGVVGYAKCCYDEFKIPTIGFDMGGTSTDVSRYDGKFEHTYESITAGVAIQAPQLDISTVAAGGGSKLFFRSGLFVVGPESAGASPGPICYKKGGDVLTVTDANLCLGRILPDYFPRIFGPGDNEQIDRNAAIGAFQTLTDEVNAYLSSIGSKAMSKEEVIMGFIRVANESMCRPIRAITQGKGFDTSQHILCVFGGAGAQHSCAIARSLGIKTVFVPRFAGILSAFGLALADVVYEKQEPYGKELTTANIGYIDTRIEVLESEVRAHMRGQGYNNVETEIYLHLRYDRTDCQLMCEPHSEVVVEMSKFGDFKTSFVKRYEKEFGFTIPERPIIVDDIRVRGIGPSGIDMGDGLAIIRSNLRPNAFTEIYFEGTGFTRSPVYLLSQLSEGDFLAGPSIIMDQSSTILVDPNCFAEVTRKGDIKITIGEPRKVVPPKKKGGGFLAALEAQNRTAEPQPPPPPAPIVEEKVVKKELGASDVPLDMIQLSIFSHRFMSIAEQMGRVLQKTSISTNIKERLDFSCAVFGPDGGLVSNAPHIPVHLGAMAEAVKYQIREIGGDLKPGDVILSNHPTAGGSHLPDLTVITPCYGPQETPSKDPIFFVASRGHHADIGGISPGSMPPLSKKLWEEGATFKSFKLVSGGVFNEAGVTAALNDPCQHPGCVGTRNLSDNLSDLRAQVAANHRGITLIEELITSLGLGVVTAYMKYIQDNAEVAVRDMLKEFGKMLGSNVLVGEDKMDDGTVIKLTIKINPQDGSAVFDFSGTGPQVDGNTNAPKAITHSAIIYCLRCLVNKDIPLNQGCLKPINIIIPEGSILAPSEEAAVVGGNVLTSQRIVDVILRCFEACAASQGCTNNLTFGDETMGYYETIAGGAGAGPSWHGRSGVHTHITNTRITDPEILETRYPVILNHFSLNPGTGGRGEFNGGDGVRREMIFRKPLTVSILSERRVFAPYGLRGGGDGAKGQNLLTKASDGSTTDLGGKTSLQVNSGDKLTILTPGGGAWGKPL